MLAIFILFLISFLGTLYVMPHSIRKLRLRGYVVRDMYKSTNTMIPTNAGIIILFTSFISIALLPLIVRALNFTTIIEIGVSDLSESNLAMLLVISIYAMYGLVDDLVDIGRKLKLLLPVIFGYPLISIINPQLLWLPIIGDFDLTTLAIGSITWNDIFRVVVIPVYIMVIANLVNMYSGYNGLQSGLSLIVIFFLLVKSWLDGVLDAVLPAGAFAGSMAVLWWYNKYPANVFEGNIGALLSGSLIGCMIVIQQYWWFGFFIFIPHSFNFLLWIAWLIMMHRHPEVYLEADGNHRKFGSIRKDGTLEVPNRLTLKWLPNYYWRLTEWQSTIMAYFITGLFCIVALFLF